MAAAKKKQDDKNLTILRELITQNGNKNCFDCNQRGPTYVNMTIGSFVCSKCSGMLRGLTPPHRVKSISMATFTPEEMAQIKSQGNDYCKATWLALQDGGAQPPLRDEQAVKDLLADKYEKRRYYLPGGARPAVTSTTAVSPVSVVSVSPPAAVSSPIFAPAFVTTVVPATAPLRPPAKPTQQACPRFPVNFATAEIFNSSQLNNNNSAPVASVAPQIFANFDKNNANNNTVTYDRYAALADLDTALRQQQQTPISEDNMKSSSTLNPFDYRSNSEVSKNPFYSSISAHNGNSYNCSNPFAVGSGATSAGQSKNPFL